MPIGAMIGAAVIGAGGALGSSAISAKAQRDAQKKAETSPLALAQKAAIDSQTAYGKQAGDIATGLFPKYTEGVDYLSGYWKSIMSDNNADALKAIAPLVQARKSMTAGQLRSLSFAPRGGGYGEAMTGIYDSQNRDILNALAGERASARTGFAQLTGDVGSRAQGLLGTAAGVSANTASQLGQMNSTSLQAGINAGQQAGQTATGLADALGPLLHSLIFKPTANGPPTPKPPVIPKEVLLPGYGMP